MPPLLHSPLNLWRQVYHRTQKSSLCQYTTRPNGFPEPDIRDSPKTGGGISVSSLSCYKIGQATIVASGYSVSDGSLTIDVGLEFAGHSDLALTFDTPATYSIPLLPPPAPVSYKASNTHALVC